MDRRPSFRWFFITIFALAMAAFASPGLSKQHSISENSLKALNRHTVEKYQGKPENTIRIPVKNGDTLLSILSGLGASDSDVLNSLKSSKRKLVRGIKPGGNMILETDSKRTSVLRIVYESNSSKRLTVYSGKGIAVNCRGIEKFSKDIEDVNSHERNSNEINIGNFEFLPGIDYEMMIAEKEGASVFNLPIDEQNRLKREAKARNHQMNIVKHQRNDRIRITKTKQYERKKQIALKRVNKKSTSLVDSPQIVSSEDTDLYTNYEDKSELTGNSAHNGGNSELREQIISIADKYRGTPYKRGHASSTATDCSGLTLQVFNEMGLKLPRTSREQFNIGVPKKKENLTKGDLVFFSTNSPYKKVTKRSKNNPKKKIVKYIKAPRRITHVGIYVGEGKFIHAPRTGYSVKVESLESEYYRKRYIGARSVVD